jgi:hypothetical protein
MPECAMHAAPLATLMHALTRMANAYNLLAIPMLVAFYLHMPVAVYLLLISTVLQEICMSPTRA